MGRRTGTGKFTIPEAESFNLNYEPQETAEDGTTAPVEAWDLSVGYEDGSYVVMNQVDLQADKKLQKTVRKRRIQKPKGLRVLRFW